MSTKAEDNSGRKAHVILQLTDSGAVILKISHQVFHLNKADGNMMADLDVQSASTGPGKLVLGRERGAAGAAATGVQHHLSGIYASKQDLQKGSDPLVASKRKARAKEIGKNSPV